MSTRLIRVDADVQAELTKRRLPGERNHNEAILRAAREYELERKLLARGLPTSEMAELAWLRTQR